MPPEKRLLDMTLGQKIKETRIKRKLTQKDVVGEYITRNMLSKIENGSAAPSIKTLEYLAGMLDVPVGYFVSGDEADSAAVLSGEHIGDIMNGMDALNIRAKEEKNITCSYLICLSVYVKAKLYMAAGDYKRALEILNDIPEKDMGAGDLLLLYETAEICCKEQEDYKTAYEYAAKRLSIKKDS